MTMPAAYTPIHHVPARRSQYAASLLHIPGEKVAKTVTLRAGNRILLAVLPSYRVNLEKLATVVGESVRLIDEQECYRLFPDCQPGVVPPFGELYGLPLYLDQTLAETPEIVFSGELSRMAFAWAIPISCMWSSFGSARSRKRRISEKGHSAGFPCS